MYPPSCFILPAVSYALNTVRAAGGFAITQDEASSAIYGMPKAAFERGVDLALPPDQIVKVLAALRHQPLGVSR